MTLPSAYRDMKRAEVFEALQSRKAAEILTDQEHTCAWMYFVYPEHSVSQEKIALEVGIDRANAQRAIARAISKLEEEGLL